MSQEPNAGAVLERLRDAAAGAVREVDAGGTGDGRDSVGSVPARYVVSPADEAQVSAVLRAASAEGLTVVPRGTGSKLSWGNPPERLDVLLDLAGLDELVEHASGDLVVVAGAGRTLDALAGDLAGAGQRLAADPARRGTLGGLVATGTSGPLRQLVGPVRDLLIGSRMVRADGVAARSGGKVVKNVAGYDVGKVLTGSFGTLGVLTQVAFRLHPVPEAARWVTASIDDREVLIRAVSDVVHSQVYPSGIELDVPAALKEGAATLSVLVEGTTAGATARAERVVALLGGRAEVSENAPPWWGREPAGSVLLKVTHELASLDRLLRGVAEVPDAAFRGSVGVGVGYVSMAPSGGPGISELFSGVAAIRAAAHQAGGTAVVLDVDLSRAGGDGTASAPGAPSRPGAPSQPGQGGALDRWGPVPALDLMRAVKDRFDPQRLLAPGRYVGGI